ncbi:MAG: DUF2058 family protein [Oligoflexus sp.]|nr:DUF2058 family protein [Oligoflexus sp.]
MNLRDQLMKSGLASKEQAKKAQREVAKQQHQKIQAARDPNAVHELSPAEQLLAAKREADRLLNIKRNEERLFKEAEARAIDIISSHNLLDSRGTETYHFIVDGQRIANVMVHEDQMYALERGELAIVSLNPEEAGFALVTAENAEKIRSGNAKFVVCQYS